ncbi:hypothetical protein [Frankia gtarii]|uniref:hypothetical protein n=1 Tax=Frankia gtarii TaxID=2950102 RepID=UPI0021BEFD2B
MNGGDAQGRGSGRQARRFQPHSLPTRIGADPRQARWADAMKTVLNREQISLPALAERVVGPLDLQGTHKLRRWLSNETTVPAHAIIELARAVGAHESDMLAAYGLRSPSISKLVRRAEEAEERERQLRARSAQAGRTTGGALFAAAAARDGRWSVTVRPHWRGRRHRCHFADHVLLERVDAISKRADAEHDFAEVFERTAASWDATPLLVEGLPVGPLPPLIVHRFTAPHEPTAHHAPTDASGVGAQGVVVTGLQWTGSYTVAALLAKALGWGLGSFARAARSVHGGARLDFALADEIMQDWLRRPDNSPRRVWAHVLTEPPGPTAPSARLLGDAGPDVRVVMVVPEPELIEIIAALSGAAPAELAAQSQAWGELLAPHPRLLHVPASAPRAADGSALRANDPRFLDAYFDASVDAAFDALRRLAGDRPVSALVPEQARLSDPFAALVASGAQAASNGDPVATVPPGSPAAVPTPPAPPPASPTPASPASAPSVVGVAG